jgi:hypothetical protein
MSQFISLQFIPPVSSGELPVYHCFPVEGQRVFENPVVGIVEYCGLYESSEDAIKAVLYEADQKEWSSDMGKFILYSGDGKQEVVHQ